jgi:hypothetical protein
MRSKGDQMLEGVGFAEFPCGQLSPEEEAIAGIDVR